MKKNNNQDILEALDGLQTTQEAGFDGVFAWFRKLADLFRSEVDDIHTGNEATQAMLKEHDKRDAERVRYLGKKIDEINPDRKKSFGLLILVIIIGAIIAIASYWFVIQSNLCHLGGLWREVVNRDVYGNIIPGSTSFELVEGAKVIWAAMSALLGASFAALIHAIVPWYRKEAK